MVNPIIITTSQPRATREGGSKDESLRWEEKPRFIRQKKENSEKKASFFGSLLLLLFSPSAQSHHLKRIERKRGLKSPGLKNPRPPPPPSAPRSPLFFRGTKRGKNPPRPSNVGLPSPSPQWLTCQTGERAEPGGGGRGEGDRGETPKMWRRRRRRKEEPLPPQTQGIVEQRCATFPRIAPLGFGEI